MNPHATVTFTSETDSYEDTYSLNELDEGQYWTCNPRIMSNYRKGAYYNFKTSYNGLVLVSTCYTTTNFDSKIVVLEDCDETKAYNCLADNEMDDDPGCDGTRAETTFNAEAGKLYYILITGVSETEIGQYKVTIEHPYDYHNDDSSNARTVVVPSEVEGNTATAEEKDQPDPIEATKALWYKFKGTGKDVFVDTCNSYTFIDTILYLYREIQQPENLFGMKQMMIIVDMEDQKFTSYQK